MDTIAFWPTVAVLTVATFTDIRGRRIPNWLVVPFMISGMITGAVTGGLEGIGRSLMGMVLAGMVGGLFAYLRAMGMGDVKLLLGVGAWVGPGQLGWALLATAMAGGFLAIGYALWHRSLGRCLDGVADVVAGFRRRGLRPDPVVSLDNPAALRMPYAGAIALGTLFSFFAR